ncbi:uncharacterized protein F4812DRAFT_60204 [Daldinia caldariorum]|uniref:uncharacterized protein n=1 Tax=Daldinia caldariorum TaxID=326644 RepID=UPI002008B7E5|nr:uncharacterized protein F4812DRAFT_60204 [Daldinia caldariorum]KAI1466636.1 hypothetical protein F4812DRAFT_60204 [Daldinia caldariorum]
MPHVGILMERSLQERSLRGAFMDLFARSAVAALGKRESAGSISGGIQDAKTAFSSWDNCMQADFCKWPVIAVIIIGGLIIFSIVWCIARCLCCGLSCCCECCHCLKCCGECCGCCDPPKGRKNKYLDEPFVPPHHEENQAYRSQAPMNPAFPPAPSPSVPQYAVFDDGDKKNADALPAMPSWEGAKTQKVFIEEESVEMEPLKKPENVQNNSFPMSNLPPHTTTPSPVAPENRNPYGPPPAQGGPNGYMAAARAGPDPYTANGQGYDNYNDYNGYGQAPQENMNQGYGMAAGAMRSQTPHQDYNNGYGMGATEQGYPQSLSPRPYEDEYGRSASPMSYGDPPSYRTAPSNNGYDNPSRMGSPGPQAGYGYGNPNGAPSRMRTPGPRPGYDYPQRSQTQTPSYNRQYPPVPQRQYSADSARPLVQAAQDQQYSEAQGYLEMPRQQSPVQNNGGFDFSSGYSRPEVHSPAPVQTQTANGGSAYPGYRTYRPQGQAQAQPQQDNWNGM